MRDASAGFFCSITVKRPLDGDRRSVHIGMSLIPSNCKQEYHNVARYDL